MGTPRVFGGAAFTLFAAAFSGAFGPFLVLLAADAAFARAFLAAAFFGTTRAGFFFGLAIGGLR